MSLHVFANFVTSFGTAANNRAETEGNNTSECASAITRVVLQRLREEFEEKQQAT